MDDYKLAVFLPVFFASLVLFFVVLFVVIALFKRVQHPVASPPSGQAGGSPAGRWNGEILGAGLLGTLGASSSSTFGIFEVRDGTMYFTPDGSSTPDWATPCSALVAQKRGAVSLNGADLSLSWKGSQGEWRTAQCNVSREGINRFMRNDFKDLRERGYASEFVHCLAANGARVAQ